MQTPELVSFQLEEAAKDPTGELLASVFGYAYVPEMLIQSRLSAHGINE